MANVFQSTPSCSTTTSRPSLTTARESENYSCTVAYEGFKPRREVARYLLKLEPANAFLEPLKALSYATMRDKNIPAQACSVPAGGTIPYRNE